MNYVRRVAYILDVCGIIWTLTVILLMQANGLSPTEKASLANQLISGILMTCTGTLVWAIAVAAEFLKEKP